MPDPSDAELVAWLRAIHSDGGDLEPAQVDMLTATSFERRAHDRLSCRVCGYRMATAAFIAYTKTGPRWLDVCWTDYGRVRTLNEVARGYPNG